MKLQFSHSGGERASVLIIVLWVSFGLVSVALYFANSMTLELRAADNRLASLEAEQAADGAARYAAYLLANAEEPGKLPDPLSYQREEVPIGESRFWFLGRDQSQRTPADPFFSLADEAARLNVNTATAAMLENLPRMTPELAAAIVDWRDGDSETTPGGAEDETYLRLRPPYKAKNGPFESIDELRLVFGMELDILYGEDVNQNGILDPNENDGDLSWPPDNRDGRLDPGLAEYLTVHTQQASTRSDGSPRIDITSNQGRQQLGTLFQEKFSSDRAAELLSNLGGGNISSILDLLIRSRMTIPEFQQIAGEITASGNPAQQALVNVNTASAAVLACIPGIDLEKAEALVSYRQSNQNSLDSPAWVNEVLGESAAQAAPYLTVQSHLFIADVCAVGRHGRGYRRVRFILDASSETPQIVLRRDLTHLGWALGRDAMQRLLLTERIR